MACAQAAARRYWGKDAARLTPAESAPGGGASVAAPLQRAAPRPLRAAAGQAHPAQVVQIGGTAYRGVAVMALVHGRVTVCGRLQRSTGPADAASTHHRCALDALEDVQGRVLYVDDGSRDATWSVLRTLAANDPRVSVMRLSRNFGKEAALTAGLDRVEPARPSSWTPTDRIRRSRSASSCANGGPATTTSTARASPAMAKAG